MVTVLFHSSATHSFISRHCGLINGVKEEPLKSVLEVSTLAGLFKLCDQMVKDFPMMIGELVLPVNLVLLSMVEFDIILRMDWLATYHASLDCFNKVMVFRMSRREEEFKYKSSRRKYLPSVISVLQAQK